MAYDEARHRVVLFGGVGNEARRGDTWEWDGTTWVKKEPSKSPLARGGHAMAYDSARRRVVLFGGGRTPGDDTWEWDGDTWIETAPVDSPPARINHAMA